MPASDGPLVETLTARERDFLRLLAEDRSNAEIAERLVLSTGTVRWYVKQLYAKLGVHSREEAVERANGALQIPTPPPHNLPTPPTPFVGRERELADLARMLADPDVRLVTILSPGGMGKTRLALALAERQLTAFPDGVYFVPLQALSAPDHLLTAIAEAVNYRFEEGQRPPLHQLGGFLRAKTLLLVLDNFEHLLEGAPLVSELLAAARSVRCLVTSRERLNLRGEAAYILGGLDYSTEDEPRTVSSAAGLFLQSVRYARPDFSPDEKDAAVIADICRLVDGMPLALELAASWADLLSPAEIAREIQGDLDFLANAVRDAPERHYSMRAVFNAAWSRLTDAERDAFMRFAVFRDGCTRHAAQAVCGASLRTLAGLVDKALLRVDSSGRYQVHELLRQFAEEQLEAVGASQTAREAHGAFYVDLLHRLEPDIKGERFFQAQAEIRGELENVRAACLWAVSRADLKPLAAVMTTLGVFFSTWDGHLITGLMFLDDVVHAQRLTPQTSGRGELLAEALAWRADVAVRLGLLQTAAALLQESETLMQRSGAIRARVVLDLTWARFNVSSRAPTGARKPHLERALALMERHPDDYLKAEALCALGWSYVLMYEEGVADSGDVGLSIARQHLEEALRASRQAGNPYSIAYAMVSRAAAVAAADYSEGKRAYREGIAYCKRTRQTVRMAHALRNLGVHYASYYIPRERERALTCYRTALSIADEQGTVAEKIRIMRNMAIYLLDQGEFRAARNCRKVQLSLIEEDNDFVAVALAGMAEIDLLEGQYADAETHITRALDLVRHDSDVRPHTASIMHYIAIDIALHGGRLDDAEVYLQQGTSSAPTLEQPWRNGERLRLQGTLACARGDIPGAKAALRESIHTFSSEAFPRNRVPFLPLARARALFSQIELEQGDGATSRALVVEVLKGGQRFLSESILLIGLAQAAHHVAPEQAVELASLVHSHRHSYGFSREQAAQLLDKLKGEIRVEVFNVAVERGRALDLAQTAQEALTWLEMQSTQDA